MKDCLLAKHEAGVWEEARVMVASLKDKDFRGEEFNALILPRCRDIIRATGHRMAYEAAAAASSDKVTQEALRLFECICVKTDLSWYCQSSRDFNRVAFFARDALAGKEALPELQAYLTQSKEAHLPRVPIMYEETWAEFIRDLPTFEAGQTKKQTKKRSLVPFKISLRLKSSAKRSSIGSIEKSERSILRV